MREMTARLQADRAELARRPIGLPTSPISRGGRRSATWSRSSGISAGGMPSRVERLHVVLVGYPLAAGPGVNPLGDEALAPARPSGGADGPCA